MSAFIFSCDSSSIGSNVGRSVGWSVGLSVGPQRVLRIEHAQLEASSSHSSFSSSSNCSSSRSISHVVICNSSSISSNVGRLVGNHELR